MTDMNCSQIVTNILTDQSGRICVSQSDTWNALGLDSFDAVMTILELEEAIGFEIPDAISDKHSCRGESAHDQLMAMIRDVRGSK
jgi:acyl carrier protein